MTNSFKYNLKNLLEKYRDNDYYCLEELINHAKNPNEIDLDMYCQKGSCIDCRQKAVDNLLELLGPMR